MAGTSGHGLSQETSSPVLGQSWPELPMPLLWPMADHSHVREAFESLLQRNAPYRFLPIRGPSGTGKSHITRQMLANALRTPGLACGRFDFKGTTGIGDEVPSFVQDLEVPVPSANLQLNERLGHILMALRQRARPAFLVFDTYEAAGEAKHWVEKQLLPGLIRHPGCESSSPDKAYRNSPRTSWLPRHAPRSCLSHRLQRNGSNSASCTALT